MGILKNGIAGNYTGKIGNLVFYVKNGKQVVRTIGKTNKPPSTKQLQTYAEMGSINKFLKPVIEFINAGFALKAKGTTKSPYNLALGYNKKHALQGSYPDVVSIDYEKVRVTEGKMWEAIDPAVTATPEGLSFTWDCPATLPWPRPTDQVMLLAYFPALQKATYLLAGANRITRTAVLHLPADLLTAYMEVYISFVAENRKEIADSTYLGAVNF